MTIIQLVPSISEAASGVTEAVLALTESLRGEGVDARIFALDGRKGYIPPSYGELLPLGIGPRRIGRSPAMKRRLLKGARAGEFEVIHNHGVWMMPNIYGGDVADRYGLPYVVSPHGALSPWAMGHGTMAKRLVWPLLQRPSFRKASLFHVTSLAESEEVRAQGFQQPIALVPLGVYVPKLESKKPKEMRTLLFLGRIHPKKGIEILLRAWQVVQRRHRDWEVLIVGPDNGVHLTEMQRLSELLGLERVKFEGPRYEQAKWETFQQADIFVLPTHSENFGISVAEALASGTPAIVSKGAPWGGLETEGAGWWIDIGVEPLTECLGKALSLPSERLAKLGKNGREWVQKEYSWSRVAQKMAETYRWLKGAAERPKWII